jgi:N utilization substance protein A
MKSDFIIALTQLAAERNLPREIVLSAIEAALVSAYRKDSITSGQNISVKLDPAEGEVSVHIVKTAVEEVEDPQQEMTLADARKIKPDAEIGDIIPTETLPHTAGRIAAQTAKQVVLQRLREAERELVYEEFGEKEGEVFTVTVQRMEPRQIIVELGRAEAILPASEQAHFERYRVGQKMKVLLQSVRRSNKGPELIVSRADKTLLKRLFEMEVPEIYNGAVEIMAIARESGARSKVAVFARQQGVDPVGSCVGLRGIRIQNIVNELHGEKIDVVEWNKDAATFIGNALSPAPVMRVELDPETATATAVVPDRQLSLAIGKEGQNARLAAKLSGWKVDIRSNVEVEAEGLARAPAAEVAEAVTVAEAPVEEPVAEVLAVAEVAAEAPVQVEPEPVLVEAEAVVQASTEEAAAAETVVEEAPATETQDAEPVEQPVEALGDLFVETVPEEVPVGAEQTRALTDLPDDIWSLNKGRQSESGRIRFAEDIAELSSLKARGGGRRGGRGGGGGARRKTKAGKRR